MVCSFINKKRYSYIFLGMLFVSSLATSQTFAAGHKKQTCTKETLSSFLADIKAEVIRCYKCDQTTDEMFELWCCKKALCKTCSKTIVFDALSETLTADENSKPKLACDVPCPASCSSFMASTCLDFNAFHQVVDNDEGLKDLYQRAKKLYEEKSLKQNELKRDAFAFCNKCEQTSAHYKFSHCIHTFCLGCFEQRIIKIIDPWILNVADSKELTAENLVQFLKQYQETRYLNFVYSKEEALFSCSNAECQSCIANEHQIKYLLSQSKALLHINIQLIKGQISLFKSENLDELFEKINEGFDNKLDRSYFKNSIPALIAQMQEDLNSLNYKLSLLKIHEQD